MTDGGLTLQFNAEAYSAMQSLSGVSLLLACLGGGLQYIPPAHVLLWRIKVEPGGSQQMLNGCFVLSTLGALQLEGDIK